MFKFLSIREQLRREREKNEALLAVIKDLENATIEIAEIVANNEEAILEVKIG